MKNCHECVHHYSPSPSGRGRGEGQVGPWRALAGLMLPYADVKTAIGMAIKKVCGEMCPGPEGSRVVDVWVLGLAEEREIQ
jgi:hypothetical protein